ncbi:transcriptional regulator with XRE-family HTH domain [Ruminococcaceae bacterium R-25]|nr:transcriptional regulator with XRE-family HTH domain [Ruminococcaceae bacterium R-25]SUQ21811.1 Transcriptional regulator, contains XRE-family HTH domain [Oscillospiraceae bacterium]
MVEFGEQLRRAREAKGMTQQSLAEQLYVTRQSVSRWECGDRYPDLLTTTKIAQILEVSLDDLLSGKEMEKVVERNPVVENKTANNIMIALYAVALIGLIVPMLNAMLTRDMGIDILTSTVVVTLIAFALKVFAFGYGLVNAIKGSLSPKRMGAVIGAFFTAMCITSAETLTRVFPRNILSVEFKNGDFLNVTAIFVLLMLPGILGTLATFFFFMKNSKHKIWPVFIMLTSSWLILMQAVSTGTMLTRYNESYTLQNTLSLILNIAVYALIIYQTITLLKKRKLAAQAQAAA